MSRIHDATLWGLTGPAAGTWYALVVEDEPGTSRALPEVLVIPVTSAREAWETTKADVVCPAQSSPTGERLVFAVWAAAPIPSHCLSEPVGVICSALTAVIDLKRVALSTDGRAWTHPMHPRASEPEWHRQLRESLVGYWDGSVMISCATIPPAEAMDASPAA